MQRAMRFERRSLVAAILRMVVLALAVPLALAGSMPLFARMIEGRAVHVCRCAMHDGHSTCACPICNAGRLDEHADEDAAEAMATFTAIRGTCGDDDPVHFAKGGTAILVAPDAPLVPPFVVARVALVVEARPHDVSHTPPQPPPRSHETA